MNPGKTLLRSSAARLAVGYVVVALVLAGAWVWSLYGPLTGAVLAQQERNLVAVAQSATLVAAETTASPTQIAERLVARTDLRMTIVAADGVVLADSANDPATMANHADRPEVADALAGTIGVVRRYSRTENREELYVAVPGSLDGRRIALRVAQPLSEIEAIASRSRRVGLMLLAVALGVAAFVARRATVAAAEPVETLSRVAARMASGDLSAKVPEVPADLEDLGHALESLREQMRTRLDALEAERETLRSAVDGLEDAVFVFEGDRVVLANSAASALFRAPAGGWRDRDLESSGLPAPLVAALRERLATDDSSPLEIGPDPAGRTLRLAVVPFGEGRSVASVSDVTERERLDRMRRDFVANASHELKTPVAGIKLLAQSAGSAAEDGDTAQALAFTAQIASEAERLRNLVADLLDLSRIESGPEKGAITDVRDAMERAVLSHRTAAARKSLGLSVDLSQVADADVYVAADPTDVAVALDNLLDNAIAYTETGAVSLIVTAALDSVAILVSDSGPGISAEHLPRIFERFYRVDASRSREGGGTGLGLALVKHVAEGTGGSIGVQSTPGVGTTFTLTLPRAH